MEFNDQPGSRGHAEANEHSFLTWLYDNLTLCDAVRTVDVIFVLAGRMERKEYGLQLFRAGIAKRLILSIGRFEVSKMGRLNLDCLEELTALRDKTAPDQRSFFVELTNSGVRIHNSKLPRASTYGEALGLRQFLKSDKPASVMLISTDVHLRRVSLSFTKVFRNEPIRFFYCPVPQQHSPLKRDGWWRRPDDRRFVFKEMMKLIGYRLILSTPDWASRRLMRLGSV